MSLFSSSRTARLRRSIEAPLTRVLTFALVLTIPVFQSRAAEDKPGADLPPVITLDAVLRRALSANPDIREAQLQVLATQARAASATRLPDLELTYQQEAVPLNAPLDIHQAEALAFGLRQTIPAPGSLAARGNAAQKDVAIAQTNQTLRERDVVAQTIKAFADYFRADQELRTHREHADLTARLLELSRINYQAGRGTQQDILRSTVELSRLHNDVASLEQLRASSPAMLNTLMARPPNAPLGSAIELKPIDYTPDLAQLEKLLEENRPELKAQKQMVQRSEADLQAARSSATWSSIMLGADYMYMPMNPGSPHGYSVMLGMNLPWLSPGRRDQVREAKHTVDAQARALESVTNIARYQLHDAAARYLAAKQSFEIIDRSLLPQARRSYEAAHAAFAAAQSDALGLLDALRSYLSIRLERSRALARLYSSLADLERSVGADLLPRTSS